MVDRFVRSVIAASFLLPFGASANGLDGNRYSDTLERKYHSEISASSAYRSTLNIANLLNGYIGNTPAVIIDVRTIEEYVGGHPPNAYSMPYPHIYNRQKDSAKGEYVGQDAADFVAAVDSLELPKDALIIPMCRTGYRSVLAGNLLADAGYTNVRNMWEGFKGRLKQNLNGEDLDLDGDGIVDGSDPYSGDLDGWANYQGLPVSMTLTQSRLFAPYADWYYNVTGER